MTKIRTIIVDDEAHARARLRQALKSHPDFEVIRECANGREALETIPSEQPDLVFLDIQMPRLNGFEVCEQLQAAKAPFPFIIFCTAYDQYAVKAFEFHAIDYLLKPIDADRFKQALAHARAQIQRAQPDAPNHRLADLLKELRTQPPHHDRLVFKQDGRVVLVRTNTIDWLEADGNYVRVHCGNESHYVRETLAGLEAQLPATKFMRISRSAVVNQDRIKEFQPLTYGEYSVVLVNGTKLTLSRNFRDRLERLLQH